MQVVMEYVKKCNEECLANEQVPGSPWNCRPTTSLVSDLDMLPVHCSVICRLLEPGLQVVRLLRKSKGTPRCAYIVSFVTRRLQTPDELRNGFPWQHLEGTRTMHTSFDCCRMRGGRGRCTRWRTRGWTWRCTSSPPTA